jgi:hypothetical protein
VVETIGPQASKSVSVSTERAPSPQNDHDSVQLRIKSSGASVVVLQHATEPFSALDLTSDGTNILIRINEMVAQALMISLAMIVLDVFTNCVLK